MWVCFSAFVFNFKFENETQKKHSCKKSCISCLHFNAATTFQWANKIVGFFFQHTPHFTALRWDLLHHKHFFWRNILSESTERRAQFNGEAREIVDARFMCVAWIWMCANRFGNIEQTSNNKQNHYFECRNETINILWCAPRFSFLRFFSSSFIFCIREHFTMCSTLIRCTFSTDFMCCANQRAKLSALLLLLPLLMPLVLVLRNRAGSVRLHEKIA